MILSEKWEQLGNSTGVHLHLEASTTKSWQCSTFINPLESIGIPNVRGTIIEYTDTPTPPTKNKNNWKYWYLNKKG